MSDLQCPATVLLTRHGDAEYETDRVVEAGGSLTGLGRTQALELGRRLSDARIAAVYCSAVARAVQTAEIAAAQLGLPVTVREGLQEFGPGDLRGTLRELGYFEDEIGAWQRGELARRVPGGESGDEIADRIFAVLDRLADEHRGETLLVVSHGGAMLAALARIGVRGLAHVENCSSYRLERDGAGWRLAAAG